MDNREAKIVILKALNYGISLFTGLSYALVLVLLFVRGEYRSLIFTIFQPLIGVILVSALRNFIDAKRPYENGDAVNLLDKKTTGKSFPSRHVFSVFVLGMTILCTLTKLGIVVLIMGVLLCFLRVISGVHYIKDVLAGALMGIVVGIILFVTI